MPLIHKLCALLRHPFRRLIRMDIDLQHAHRTPVLSLPGLRGGYEGG